MDKKELAFELIKTLEGFSGTAYQNKDDIPTIGYGTTFYPDGKRVEIGDVCTPEEAFAFFSDYCEKYVYPFVDSLNNDIPDNIYAAICSLIYNIGQNRAGPALKNAIEQSNWRVLADVFNQYIFSNGKIDKGLKNRRKIEVEFMESKYGTR